MILAICLSSAALLAVAVAIPLGVIGYRRLDSRHLDLEDRIDRVEITPAQPRPTPPTSLFDRRPDEI